MGGSLAENVALPSSSCLLDGLSGGLYVNGGGVVPANSGGPFDIEGPYIYRYKRSFSAAAPVAGRTIIVDPSAEQGVFPVDVAGVLNQYPGMRQPGNASTDVDVAGRDAVIHRAAQAGFKTIRFPDLTAFLRFTYTPGGANNGISGHDWTDFDSRINIWKRQGVTRFHADFLGTPPPLRPGAFPFHPTDGIGRQSTTLPAPDGTTRMAMGTALFLSEGAKSETVYLTSEFAGGAGDIKISATARAYSHAVAVNIGHTVRNSSGNVGFAPAIDNAAWGQVCADAVDRLINFLGITIIYLGFWNEPLSANHYGGNQAAYVAQWLAAARQINSDSRLAASGVKLGAGEPAMWLSSETSADDSETGWQKAIVEQATASGLPMPALSYHSYTGSLNVERRAVQDQLAYLRSRGLPGSKVQIGEWNMDLVAASQVEDVAMAGANHPDVWGNEYLAAYAHAFISEMMSAGVEGMIFTRLQQADVPGAERRLHLYSSGNPAKAFGVGEYFEMLWKVHAGATKFSCQSNWPDLRAFGAKSGASPTTYTIFYGRYRPWRSQSDSDVEVDIEWDHMPSRFKWRRWHLDRTNAGDGTLKQVAGGDQSSFPRCVNLLPLSVGCLQVVG
jgi:hypothetical protein